MNIACDTLVIGAGVSGIAAAISSARSGAQTILAEKEDFLGGVAYSGLLQYICGLYLNGDEFPAHTLNQGIAREIAGRLNRMTPQNNIKKIGQVYVLPYKREDLSAVFSYMCTGEPDLTVFCMRSVISVKMENGKVIEAELSSMNAESPDSPFAGRGGITESPCSLQERSGVRDKFNSPASDTLKIAPKIVVDCSGSGIVSFMAGAPFEISPPDNIQMAGYIIRLKGLKDIDDTLALRVPYYLAEAVDKGIFTSNMRYTVFSPGDSPDEGYCKMGFDMDDPEQHGKGTAEYAEAMRQFLADRIPSFRDSYIAETSLGVMDREGRRVSGEYTLTEDDVLKARKFEDGVVKNSWPIEIWSKSRGTVYKYLDPGEYYEIPFRCMKVKGLDNLLVAGRCISVTHEALGSTRMMGTCMSLGEQAGLAAAYYAEHGRYPSNFKEKDN